MKLNSTDGNGTVVNASTFPAFGHTQRRPGWYALNRERRYWDGYQWLLPPNEEPELEPREAA